MANLLVYQKQHGKAKLFLDVQIEQEWLSGESIYSLMPRAGRLFPILQGRTSWEDPIELEDSIAFAVDRSFMFE